MEYKNVGVRGKNLFSFEFNFFLCTIIFSLLYEAPPPQTEEIPEDDSSKNPDIEERKQLSIRDIVDLQETGFTVKIQPPGTESFELQVQLFSHYLLKKITSFVCLSEFLFWISSNSLLSQVSGQMLVAELHQVLMDHEITCHRTCFSLQQGGSMLDSLTMLSSIPGIQEGALIKVVEGNCLLFFLFFILFVVSLFENSLGYNHCGDMPQNYPARLCTSYKNDLKMLFFTPHNWYTIFLH